MSETLEVTGKQPPRNAFSSAAACDLDALMTSLEAAALDRNLVRDLVQIGTLRAVAVGFFQFGDCRISLLDGVLRVSERQNGQWKIVDLTDYTDGSPVEGPASFIEELQFAGKRALMRACGMTRDAVAPAKLSWKQRVGKVWKSL